jgi:hypothetical protein
VVALRPQAVHAAGDDCDGVPCPKWDYPLSRAQFVMGMQSTKMRVAACLQQFKSPGMALVVVTIVPSGSVSQAKVSGVFSQTPTGRCVEDAVKSGRFPAFTGAPMSVSYPFMLR